MFNYLTLLNILTNIIGVVITGIIGICIEKRMERAKPLLIHSKIGTLYTGKDDLENNISVVEGYYLKQKEFNEQLFQFLNEKNYYFTCTQENVLRDLVIIYQSKCLPDLLQMKRYSQIYELYREFKNEETFMALLKSYEAYMNHSKWTLEIVNTGKKNMYNVKIKDFEENCESSITIGKTLASNEKLKLMLYYFDQSIIVNVYDVFSKYSFEIAKRKDWLQKFYLVRNWMYNEKDEKIFQIEYTNEKNKVIKYYCCAKLVKEKARPHLKLKNFVKQIKEWINEH